jgi:hypothetical protein
MIPDALETHQRTSLVPYISSLFTRCVARFRSAALLVGADMRQWPAIDRYMSTSVDLAPFADFWARVCNRYNRDVFGSQSDLWQKSADLETEFSQFIHWRLWPLVASENECARNVLRIAGSLPSKSQEQAARALVVYIDDLTFDVDMKPLDPGYFE